MEEFKDEQEFQKQMSLKMTITNASSSEPSIAVAGNCTDTRQGLTNGSNSSATPSAGNQISPKSGTNEMQKYKSNSSNSGSHKPSLTSSSKDISQHKNSAAIENQNGFSKQKDHHSSSSSRPRDHSNLSRDKEKQHSSSLSSTHKDNHSSSRSKEHSSSSSKSESSSKNKEGSRGSSKEGSSSKNRGESYGRVESSSKSRDALLKDVTGVGEKIKSSDGTKVHFSSSESSLSSSNKHHSSKTETPLKTDSAKSAEKHHHRTNKELSVELAKSKSPVRVKTEISSPLKSPDLKSITKSDNESDAPLYRRLQHSSNAPKEGAVKAEHEDEDDDKPLFSRLHKAKPEAGSDDDDDIPLVARLDKVKVKTEDMYSPSPSKKRKYDEIGDESDEPLSARVEKVKKVKVEERTSKKCRHDDDFKTKKPIGQSSKKQNLKEEQESPKKGKKKQEDAAEETKWKWWEENKHDDGVKWNTLEHKGPVFAPPYEPLPSDINFYYDGKNVKLSESAEEVATFYAKMLDHDYTTRDLFNSNFLKDWRKSMTSKEKEMITDLRKCNFKEMHAFFKQMSEERKNMSKEDKLQLKKENEKTQKEYGFCVIDGHRQKIGNFKIEPPGLFRGRGDHPKQGMLKKRTLPEDVIINCSKGSKVPNPPPGHKWKEVRHDNTVTWLASWSENIQGSIKYIMLNAASKLKGEKDWMKYETARRLHKCVDKIRRNYREDWKSKEMKIRQRAVALYFIDKLALRAGNEKDEDTADTVGCCSLRVEHIKLHEELNGQEFVVEFDFLGKDSIRYYNTIAIEKRVFKNLQLFMENKQDGDDLFDRLNTTILNKHLQSLMDGLTAKVFRTYNASRTLQEQLDLLTNDDDNVAAKLLSYNRANRAVAVLCNHQRAAPKNFDKQMENLQGKIDAKKEAIKMAKKDLKDAKSEYKARHSESARSTVAKKEKALERLKEQLTKLEVQATDKDENKEIALSTSKLNYLDPRITVAWCKKWNVPIEKVYNKTQREKFAWAIDMANKDYHF